MWKKAFSFLVLAVVIIHLAGFYVYFVVRLDEIRTSMRLKLAEFPTNQLQAISIPFDKFQSSWLGDLEMEWKGNMYDIARVQPSGDDVVVFCLRDEDEDGLLNFIGAVVDMSRQDTRPAPPQVVQFFSLKYVTSLPLAITPLKRGIIEPGICSFIFPESLSFVPSIPPPRG